MDFIIQEIKAPLVVQFELTYECNNYCKFCYNVWKDSDGEFVDDKMVEKREKENDISSYDEICEMLDNIKDSGVFQVTFTGGEPTLHPNFLEIIEYAVDKGLDPIFITNGNLITPEFAKKIKETGLKSCQVSMHGSNSETHERLTMVKGSFNKGIVGIKNLVKNGLNVNINMTVNKNNMDDIWNTAIMSKKLGAKSFTITRFVYVGSGSTYQEQLGLDLDDQNHLVEMINKVEDEIGLRTRILTPIPLCAIDKPEDIAGKMSKCDAGLTWCAISPQGNVRTCTNADKVVGNLKEDSLSSIWQKAEEFRKFRALDHVPDNCKECKAFNMCGGGCRACGYNYSNGDYKAPDPCSDISNVDGVNKKIHNIKKNVLARKIDNNKNDWLENIKDRKKTMVPFIYGTLNARKEEFGILASVYNKYAVVNEHGLEILIECKGEKTVAEIIQHFSDLYDQPIDVIEEGVILFLKRVTFLDIISWKTRGESKKSLNTI